MSKSFSVADVASHSKPDSLYIIVDEDVYDLTKFQDEHPGGKKSRFIPIIPEELSLTPASLAESGRQRCIQAVLEIP